VTTTVQQQRAAGRDLIDPALFDRLTRRITTDHPHIDRVLAERILDQALAFLGTCATATRPLGPSPAVDIGWHTLILHTAEYARLCDRIAGRFIHHQPDDQPAQPGEADGVGAVSIADTLAAITAAGYRIDREVWTSRADCSQCHAGCTDSPKH